MASTKFVENVDSGQCLHCSAAIDVSHAQPMSDITCPACGKSTTVPGMLDHYKLIRVLGQGSAGIVYQAFDQEYQRDAAVKVFLKKKGEASKERREKFVAEATAMRSFNHPNVVKIYHVAEKAEKPFIVMELLKGEQLDRMIEDRWLVEEPKAVKIALDVAEGLKAVHDAGFAHLDVKPGNMQLDGQGVCKLLDYDTARALHDIESKGAGLVGTPYYVAPEVIRHEQVDFRADMYSLGSTLFHLLAQCPPFQGATSRDVVQERLKRRAITLKEVRPDVSNETSLAVARMLEPQPRDRYPDYATLIADLRRALDASQWDARLKVATPSKQNGKSLGLPAVLAGAALIALIGIGIWFGTRSGNTAPTTDSTTDKDDSELATKDFSSTRDRSIVTGKDQNVTTTKDSNTQPTKDRTNIGTKDGLATKDVAITKDSIKPPPVEIAPLNPIIKPAPLPPKVKPADWIAGKDVEVSQSGGKLVVFCIGKTPYIRCPRVEGPNRQTTPDETAALLIRLRSSSKGASRLYWNTPSEPLWNEERSHAFVVEHNNEWHERVIPIRTDAAKLELRIDVGEGAGIVEIDHIRYYLNIAKDVKPAVEWTFDGDGESTE